MGKGFGVMPPCVVLQGPACPDHVAASAWLPVSWQQPRVYPLSSYSATESSFEDRVASVPWQLEGSSQITLKRSSPETSFNQKKLIK